MKCAECNCVMPPDSNKCPACGHTGAEVRKKTNGITMGRIGYAIKCEEHGHIHITASVASVPTRCPFC